MFTSLWAFALAVVPVVWAQSNPDPVAIAKKVRETYRWSVSLHSEGKLTIEIKTEGTQFRVEGAVSSLAVKPSKVRMEFKHPTAGFLLVSDGDAAWIYKPSSNQYTTLRAAALRTLDLSAYSQITEVMKFDPIVESIASARFLGIDPVETGTARMVCYMLEARIRGGTVTTWVDAMQYVLRRVDIDTEVATPQAEPTKIRFSLLLNQVSLNEPVPDSQFKFTAPEGAKEVSALPTLAGKPVAPTSPPDTRTSQRGAGLLRAGLDAFNRGNYTTAVALLKQVVALEPGHHSAWNELGRSHFALEQFDSAIEAYRKQIEINPKDMYAFNNLGRALWGKEKRDEAIAAFKKQIEINPQDRYAHANLGKLYNELHRYSEAFPELEKAIALVPEDPGSRVQLGETYLSLGQTEKGLSVLEEVALDKPSPSTWNNVAYHLASHKLQLERAQRYAESAVTITAAALRNVELRRVTPAELRNVNSLGHYWDTLGWVHYQRGNVEEASKFISAAWLLNQQAVVGYHLAQVYENLGRRQEAIQALSGALAAGGSQADIRNHLAALVGSEDQIGQLVRSARDELIAMRTVKLGKLLTEKAIAEFYVAMSPGTKKVEEVGFIQGDEKLRRFTEALTAASYPVAFPDSTPVRLVRRGTVICPGDSGDCVIELLTAERAQFAQMAAEPDGPAASRMEPYSVGGSVTAPQVLFKVDPEYSEEARQAKHSGTVLLQLVVDSSGEPRDLRVVRSLGKGLDEKAIEAVNQWKFRPGIKDGRPVAVLVTIEVNFRLLETPKNP